MASAARDRIAALDLIRGVAVLGILAVNVASFAAPLSATYSPDLPTAGSGADRLVFTAGLVLFEGKMRALFSMLFGASLLLFVERAEDAGRGGFRLQLRRLGWLALFGYLHFLLLWDGDILFLYAAVGAIALMLRRLAIVELVTAALMVFSAWQLWTVAQWLPVALAEHQVAAGHATAQDRADLQQEQLAKRSENAADLAETQGSFPAIVESKLSKRPWYPLLSVLFVSGETLPLMLLGMALLRSGLFAGQWPRRRVVTLAVLGLTLGGGASLAFALWALANGFPEMMMYLAIGGGLAFAHLALALGYAATLVLAAPWLAVTWLGQRLIAAGRMAFSNYLGTSLVMCTLFNGWGLALFGRFGAAAQFGFVLLGWALMLGWSEPWLRRFRQGPLEWLWRSLTEWRRLPFRRAAIS